MGKLLAVFLGLSAVIAGGAMYYLQIYGYYDDVVARPEQDVVLMPLAGDDPQPIAYGDFQAIDSDSSPIRYRACFSTRLTPNEVAQVFALADKQEPRNAPDWFDCFDADAIGAALESGEAMAFLSIKNIHFGVDRIVAITNDGRGFAWHELNNCGEKAYDGTIVGEECPTRDN